MTLKETVFPAVLSDLDLISVCRVGGAAMLDIGMDATMSINGGGEQAR